MSFAVLYRFVHVRRGTRTGEAVSRRGRVFWVIPFRCFRVRSREISRLRSRRRDKCNVPYRFIMIFFSTGVAGLLAGGSCRRGGGSPTEAENGVPSKLLPAGGLLPLAATEHIARSERHGSVKFEFLFDEERVGNGVTLFVFHFFDFDNRVMVCGG